MRTATPWWLAWSHLAALVLLFVSERFLGLWDGYRLALTGVSAAALAGVVVARAVAVARTRDNRRRVEVAQLAAAVGSVLAVGLYLLSTDGGLALLGQAGAPRLPTMLVVLAAVVAAASVLPIVMIEATLGTERRERFDFGAAGDDGAVEYRRVAEVGGSGLEIALAAAFLMVTCNVARERNLREDVSYFKTSQPSGSTQRILANTSEKVEALLFFPAVNEVKDEVAAYFRQLARATGKLEVIEADPVARKKLADEHKVLNAGVVVLARGEGEARRFEKLDLGVDIDRARRPQRSTAASAKPSLRTFDGAVNAALMKLVRDKRRAYLAVGHGEINDPDSLPADVREKLPDAKATVIKAILQAQNYEVKNLGLLDGLGGEIPEDATMVLVLGPRTPLLDDELAALDRYLARGGNLMIALDPRSDATLGPLEQRLGLRFDRAPLMDDKNNVASRGPRWVVTNQFSSHASITSLSKAAANEGVLLLDAGALDEVQPASGAKPRRTHVIKSMAQAWRDVDGNGAFTEGLEKRDRHVVATAVEAEAAGEGTDAAAGFRAMVFADVDLFVDRAGSQAGGQLFLETWGGPIPADAIRWIGGEEQFAGEVTSENDVEIRATKKQDSWWFLLTMIIAPLTVLAGGLLATRRRRRPRAAAPVAASPAPKEESP
jgi:hypothetical protein